MVPVTQWSLRFNARSAGVGVVRRLILPSPDKTFIMWLQGKQTCVSSSRHARNSLPIARYWEPPPACISNSTQPLKFVETLEHRRFAEFCDACGRYRYIGLCYGRPGVGKTLSARRCSRWDYFDNANPYTIPDETLAALIGVRTIFYTTPVVNTPRQIDRDIARLRSQLQFLAKEPLRREAAQKLKQINIRDNRHAEEMFTTHDWLSQPMPKLKPTYVAISRKYAAKEKGIGDPTQLILVDEADRLKMASLEQMRAIFDAGGIGLVLIGMPGLERRLARYAQFYFAHRVCT
jgi:hypothetical protein